MHSEDTPHRQPDPPDRHEFDRLIRAAKEGSEEALGRLVMECRPYLLAIANRELDDELAGKVGASDIVQNSILSAQRCFDDFRGNGRDDWFAWLRGFLIKDLKQTHRHYRADKRRVNREQPLRNDSVSADAFGFVDDGDSPSTAANNREREVQLYHAMERLSPDEREVIDLRNWKRLSFNEIGSRMGRTPDAARKLWSRAIVRLQKLLEPVDGV